MKTRFKIRRHGPRQFYWVALSPGNQILARGPVCGKYYQSDARARASIATVKNGAASWLIED